MKNMKIKEKIKLFKDVFAPKPGEKVLFLIDIPHNDIKDNTKWIDRRQMANEWIKTFQDMGEKEGFNVEKIEYKATGVHNSPIPKKIADSISRYNLVIAMTQFSASTTLVPLCRKISSNTRCASMPEVDRRMEETAFKADYKKVRKYAITIKEMLKNSIGADVLFSTGDSLYIDFRNRNPEADTGDCTKPGKFINFPSGEGCITPYEAVQDEIQEFGESKTEGIMPVDLDGELVKFQIKNNKIVNVIGCGKKADEMRNFFNQNYTRRNIAELGIGCNPNAVITGNVLEDEKVGLHIAYGMSSHLGGKIKSDMHQDICYSKGCPVEGRSVTLINKDGSKIELIKDANLRYDLLE